MLVFVLHSYSRVLFKGLAKGRATRRMDTCVWFESRAVEVLTPQFSGAQELFLVPIPGSDVLVVVVLFLLVCLGWR